MPEEEKLAYDEAAKAGALRDCEDWVNAEIEKLNNTKDVHDFHQQWHHILRRGRRAAGAGRFFRDENGAGAYTIADELEGWAAYQGSRSR